MLRPSQTDQTVEITSNMQQVSSQLAPDSYSHGAEQNEPSFHQKSKTMLLPMMKIVKGRSVYLPNSSRDCRAIVILSIMKSSANPSAAFAKGPEEASTF
jgi:hypothetical protein